MERETGEMAAKCMDFEIFCLPLPREGEGETSDYVLSTVQMGNRDDYHASSRDHWTGGEG